MFPTRKQDFRYAVKYWRKSYFLCGTMRMQIRTTHRPMCRIREGVNGGQWHEQGSIRSTGSNISPSGIAGGTWTGLNPTWRTLNIVNRVSHQISSINRLDQNLIQFFFYSLKFYPWEINERMRNIWDYLNFYISNFPIFEIYKSLNFFLGSFIIGQSNQ